MKIKKKMLIVDFYKLNYLLGMLFLFLEEIGIEATILILKYENICLFVEVKKKVKYIKQKNIKNFYRFNYQKLCFLIYEMSRKGRNLFLCLTATITNKFMYVSYRNTKTYSNYLV